MNSLARAARWLLLRWLPILGLPSFALCYLVLHRGMGIPGRAIVAPWFFLSALSLAAAPILPRLAEHGRNAGGNFRPFFVAAGAFGMGGAFILLHYASVLGLLSPEAARGSCVAGLIGTPACFFLLYRLRDQLFPGLFCARPEGNQVRPRSG